MQQSRAQEQLSFSYITAVASQARIATEFRRWDEDGIDGVLISDQGTEPRIDFQAKSVTGGIPDSDHIAYALKVNNYNRLTKSTTNLRILIVMVVPSCIEEWTDQNNERMQTRYSAYWHSLRGCPPTDNTQTKTVHIPKRQILNPSAVQYLIERADVGDIDDV